MRRHRRHARRERGSARGARRLVVALLALIAACAPTARGEGVDAARALIHVRELVALGPRPGDGDAARAAAAYIEQTLAALGVRVERVPVGTVTIPDIDVLGVRHRQGGPRTARDPNLVARFGPARGPALLVMAHYDSVAGSPGATDNAAAVGVVLELARVLAATPPATPVVLAFTSNEERGLLGAEALAARWPADAVALAISLDLIGGTGDLSLNGAGALIRAAELRWLAAAADRAGVTIRAPLAHRVISRWWPQAERSDHGAFTRRGVRALHLYHRGQDGELIDRAYHTPLDDLDRVVPAQVTALGRLLVALARTPPPTRDDGDGYWLPIATNTVVPRWSLLAVELALLALAVLGLARLRASRARGGLGLVAGVVALGLALAAAYALEVATRGAHPAPWQHAPAVHVVALGLVIAGVLGLATRAAARLAPWVGTHRYLAVAIAWPLALGAALLALGAAELAWIWLVPAAIAALGPRLGRARGLVIVAALLPAVLVLAPAQLREAAWNGFAPAAVPLTAWVALVGVPVIAATAWTLRVRGSTGPLGTLVLSLGWALAMIVGAVMVVRAEPPCSAAQFLEFHLGCEIRPGVR